MTKTPPDPAIKLTRSIADRPVYRRTFEKADGRYLRLYGYDPHTSDEISGQSLDMQAGSELRQHPLLGSWGIYAARRNNRTFKPDMAANPLAPSRQGMPLTEIPFGDFELCVFENRFPGLHRSTAEPARGHAKAAKADGACEVLVYGAEPTGSLATLGQAKRRLILEAWIDRYLALFSAGYSYVLPFENRGDEVGVTLHHPHGQIYAFPFLPEPQAKAQAAFDSGFELHTKLTGWAENYGVEEAGGMMAYVPPFARFPYEVWISARRRISGPWEFDETESDGFAHLLGAVTARYDAMFGRQTPLMLSLQASPGGENGSFEFTAQFYPLLRAPDRVKYLAAVEQSTGVFTVDVLPEMAANALRQSEYCL